MSAVLAALAPLGWTQEKSAVSPVQVTIKDEKPVVGESVESARPVDPVRRINFQPGGLTASVTTENNQTLHLSHFASLHIDGQVYQNGQGPGTNVDHINRPLGKDKNGKDREGFSTCFVYPDGLRITATATLVATKITDKSPKRRRDAMLTRYVIENKGTKPRKVGLRVYMDTFVIDNDGCLFAAPNFPNKLLDGMTLKGKELPPYLKMLQRPDLKNPGFVSHLTLDLGSRLEKPDRLLLTRYGLAGTYDMPVVASMGDSAIGVYWDPKEIKPGGKREFAFGYGQGIVPSPEAEGRVELTLGGSFAPGKLFSVTVYVNDPAPGQTLELELPAGMTLVDGPALQSVPAPRDGAASSLVFWRARVLRPGTFAVRVRSSMGVTEGKLISVTPSKR